MRKRRKLSLLLLAARKKDREMVKLLLDNEADDSNAKYDRQHGGASQRMVDGEKAEKNDLLEKGAVWQVGKHEDMDS